MNVIIRLLSRLFSSKKESKEESGLFISKEQDDKNWEDNVNGWDDDDDDYDDDQKAFPSMGLMTEDDARYIDNIAINEARLDRYYPGWREKVEKETWLPKHYEDKPKEEDDKEPPIINL